MSALVIGNGFKNMAEKLEELGIRNAFLCDPEDNEATVPFLSLVPYIDMLILGREVRPSGFAAAAMREALDRHIPVVREDCLGRLAGHAA